MFKLTLICLLSLKIGKSLFDEEGSKIVRKLYDNAKAKGIKLHLPVDFTTGSTFSEDAEVRIFLCIVRIYMVIFQGNCNRYISMSAL